MKQYLIFTFLLSAIGFSIESSAAEYAIGGAAAYQRGAPVASHGMVNALAAANRPSSQLDPCAQNGQRNASARIAANPLTGAPASTGAAHPGAAPAAARPSGK